VPIVVAAKEMAGGAIITAGCGTTA